MRVAVYYNNRDVRIEERPVPEPGPGEILVKTAACGVCVADTMEWYLTPRAPLVLGHEPTGTIEKTGPGVKTFKKGDRVFVHHHIACLACSYCRQGHYTMCALFRPTHIQPGGFAEFFIASKEHVERDTLLLPDSVSFEAGSLIEPLACIVHAIRKAGVQPGDSVVLIGTGTMGLMFIEALLAYGISKLVVYELDTWRQEKAREFGAPIAWKPDADPVKEAERLRCHFNAHGADKVIVAAKDVSAMELGMHLVNKGGTVLFFATPAPDESISLLPSQIFFAEQTITASYSADHIDTRLTMDLIARGSISTDRLITHTYPLDQLSDAIQMTAARGKSLKCIITV